MLKVREALVTDVAMMLTMLRESAKYQGNLDQLCVNEETLIEDGFGVQPRYHALIAEWNGETAGLALYVTTYSTWVKSAVIHLEDLYVREKFRQHGVGRRLMAATAQVAVRKNASMRWFVLRANQPALQFYSGLNATISENWPMMSLGCAPLEELAKAAE